MTNPTYRLLPTASQHSCRALVRDHSFLTSGNGAAYALHGETGIARRVASFPTNDAERPFTDDIGSFV